MKTYLCKQCNVECQFGYSKRNLFCSNACQGRYKWVNITIPRIERGECRETKTLRPYLIETRGDNCSECNTSSTWNGRNLTLHVDHIDGNSDNNTTSNLRLLCPNCHSQTDTFGSKGIGNRYRKSSRRLQYLQQYRDKMGD